MRNRCLVSQFEFWNHYLIPNNMALLLPSINWPSQKIFGGVHNRKQNSRRHINQIFDILERIQLAHQPQLMGI
jgi:hypothetical protein